MTEVGTVIWSRCGYDRTAVDCGVAVAPVLVLVIVVNFSSAMRVDPRFQRVVLKQTQSG